MRKCINCKWTGEIEKDSDNIYLHCPICGDNTVLAEIGLPPILPNKESDNLSTDSSYDLNKDGKVDAKDKTLAAKVLASKKGRR